MSKVKPALLGRFGSKNLTFFEWVLIGMGTKDPHSFVELHYIVPVFCTELSFVEGAVGTLFVPTGYVVVQDNLTCISESEPNKIIYVY